MFAFKSAGERCYCGHNPHGNESVEMREQLRVACEGKPLFEDPAFPSDDTSVFSHESTPIGRLRGTLTWLRPQVNVCHVEMTKPGHANPSSLVSITAAPETNRLTSLYLFCTCRRSVSHLLSSQATPTPLSQSRAYWETAGFSVRVPSWPQTSTCWKR